MLKNKDNVIKILLASVFILVVCISICKIQYTNSHQTHTQQMTKIKEYEWDFIISCITHYYDSAIIKSNTIARLIEQDMEYIYNTTELKLELQTNFSSNILPDDFYNILKKHTLISYFNSVENDENTLVITKNNRVILGVDKTYEIVDLDNDIKYINSVELFKDANYRINNSKIDTPIFIANSKNTISIMTSEINILKDYFIRDGIEIFRGFIFLSPSYIEENEDFFGVPDIDRNGNHRLNDKIIVIQRFNFYDQFMNNSTDLQIYDEFKAEEKLLIQEFDMTMKNSMVFVILTGIIVILIFVIIIFFVKKDNQGGVDSLRNQ